jgi:hypothetical protein
MRFSQSRGTSATPKETKFRLRLQHFSLRKPYDMDAIWAAVITGSFGLLAVVVTKFAKENRDDHAVVQGILRGMHKTIYRTEDKIDKVNDKLSGHLENHQK